MTEEGVQVGVPAGAAPVEVRAGVPAGAVPAVLPPALRARSTAVPHAPLAARVSSMSATGRSAPASAPVPSTEEPVRRMRPAILRPLLPRGAAVALPLQIG